jgi:hypothetical protein
MELPQLVPHLVENPDVPIAELKMRLDGRFIRKSNEGVGAVRAGGTDAP